MLILTRKVGESITIGEEIQIKVLSVKGGQVRIGVDAPKSVRVARNDQAASSLPSLTHESDAVDSDGN